jgi:hypothetical protein
VSDALNGVWRINVSGQVYGPYTGYQIKAFAAEGRVAPHSIVQADERGPWITAIDDPVLSQFFVVGSLPAVQALDRRRASAPAPVEAPRPVVPVDPVYANFVVMIDVGPQTLPSFEGAISKIGECFRLSANVWLVHTDRSANAIRSELAPHMSPHDSLFVVDATRDKTVWLNIGASAEAKVRQLWKTAGDKYDA